MNRTVSGRYRNPYRPSQRFGLKPMLSQAGQATRFVTLDARESAVDWQGSFYRVQVAEFVGMPDGWRWREKVYPSLLRAVRAALASGVR